jgi:hypothetical protein
MPQVVVQTMFKPNPGADMMKLMDLVKESAAIFKRHGADVSVWAVSGGEIGNMVFAARYDSFAAYGACMEKVYSDPAFAIWTAKGVASGLSTWVRSNVAREVSIG